MRWSAAQGKRLCVIGPESEAKYIETQIARALAQRQFCARGWDVVERIAGPAKDLVTIIGRCK